MIYIISSVFFFILCVIIIGIGRRALSFFKIQFVSHAEDAVFSYGVGFGVISYFILINGIFKGLYTQNIVFILFILAVICKNEIIDFHKPIWTTLKGFKNIDLRNGSLITLSLSAVVLTYLAALAPSYSNDSMVYHLTDAKYFASTHSIGQIPYNSTNALWPYLVEMYFTLALLFKLPPLAGLFHFSLAIATMAAIYAFSKRFFSNKIALIASTIFILTPGIFMEAKETYVDLGMVFYTFLAFYAFLIWSEKRENRWAALSGIICGLAMSVKFFGAVTFLIVGLFFVAWNIKQKKSVVNKSILLFILCVIAASCTWYIRQYMVFGNPLFPFYQQIFGKGGLDSASLVLLSEGSILRSFNKDISIKGLMVIPWRLTMFPKEFGGEQIGPVFLAILPGLILLRPIEKNLKPILSFAIIYAVIWFLVYQNLRFFLPLIPFLSIAVAYVLQAFFKKDIFARLIWALVLVFLIISALLCFYHCREAAGVVLGLESKADYLNRNERSFGISGYINKELPAAANVLVINEGHTFFIDRKNKRELYYWIYTRYDKKFKTANEVVAYFKSEGFTHILYAQRAPGTAIEKDDTRLTDLVDKADFRDKYLRQVYETKPYAKNAEGIRYVLYEIAS